MRDKIKFIEKLAESMNENKIESVKYEDSNFEILLTKKQRISQNIQKVPSALIY